MNFFVLDPEVAGELGKNSELDTSVHPPLVRRLHFEVGPWLGDDLVQTFPCYLVTARLKESLETSQMTCIRFVDVEITASDAFRELNPGKPVPEFAWLKIQGQPGKDDFGLTRDSRLVVSRRALDALRQFRVKHCSIENYP